MSHGRLANPRSQLGGVGKASFSAGRHQGGSAVRGPVTFVNMAPRDTDLKHSVDFGVMTRLPRISPDEPLQYKHYTIPAGV